jgi:hypothetical protein
MWGALHLRLYLHLDASLVAASTMIVVTVMSFLIVSIIVICSFNSFTTAFDFPQFLCTFLLSNFFLTVQQPASAGGYEEEFQHSPHPLLPLSTHNRTYSLIFHCIPLLSSIQLAITCAVRSLYVLQSFERSDSSCIANSNPALHRQQEHDSHSHSHEDTPVLRLYPNKPALSPPFLSLLPAGLQRLFWRARRGEHTGQLCGGVRAVGRDHGLRVPTDMRVQDPQRVRYAVYISCCYDVRCVLCSAAVYCVAWDKTESNSHAPSAPGCYTAI